MVLLLTALLTVGAAAPAASQSFDIWNGYTPCTGGDTLYLTSIASGTVEHYVDNSFVGVFYNGSFTHVSHTTTPSQTGNWSVWSWGGWITSAYADCWDSGGGNGGGEEYETAPSVSGFQSCPSSTVSIQSWASGQVGHSVYGQTQGTWNNGASFLVNVSHTSFQSGQWMAWSTGGEVRLVDTFAFCY